VYHLADGNNSGKSGADVMLKGHDAEGYELAWSPMKEGLLLSGSYQRFQVVRLAGRAGRATSRLIAIRTTTRTINRVGRKLFRFPVYIFRFPVYIFRFTYFGFPFRISVQRRCFIFVVRSVAPERR
jgi:hypothetical protein